MTEADRAQWRSAGLKADEIYADDLGSLMQGREDEDVQIQRLIELLGVNLQGEAQRLRENATPEELIEEYTRAAVESVMLRMQALRVAAT